MCGSKSDRNPSWQEEEVPQRRKWGWLTAFLLRNTPTPWPECSFYFFLSIGHSHSSLHFTIWVALHDKHSPPQVLKKAHKSSYKGWVVVRQQRRGRKDRIEKGVRNSEVWGREGGWGAFCLCLSTSRSSSFLFGGAKQGKGGCGGATSRWVGLMLESSWENQLRKKEPAISLLARKIPPFLLQPCCGC